MAAPNIVNVATITGKTAVQVVGTSPNAIVSNVAWAELDLSLIHI